MIVRFEPLRLVRPDGRDPVETLANLPRAIVDAD